MAPERVIISVIHENGGCVVNGIFEHEFAKLPSKLFQIIRYSMGLRSPSRGISSLESRGVVGIEKFSHVDTVHLPSTHS